MDKINYSSINLNKVCRACLCENEEMKNMFNTEQNQGNLLEMFLAVSSIEVKTSNTTCTNICKQCEEKLNISYRFQLQCQKSNEVLLTHIEKETNEKCETPCDEVKTEMMEQCKQDDLFDNDERSSDDSDFKPCSKRNTQIKTKSKNIKQTMRLTQFSYDAVSQAIKETRKKFFENTECIKCGFVGSNTRALSVHMTHLHKDLKERWCVQCNKECDNLRDHLKEHGNDDLKCQFCDKVFHAKGHLTEHLLSHSGIRPYKCDTCEKCFISQRHLKVHYRIHSNERPYKCHLCTKSFIQKTSLKSHLKQHAKEVHKISQSEYDNYDCNNSIEGNKKIGSEIVNEEQTAAGNLTPTAQNFCIECNKKVRSLILHNKQFHDDDKKVFNEYGDNVLDNKLCTVCGKQFKTASKLRVHTRVHTGEAPYKCSYCDKRVSTRNQLVVHERIHTGEKPHVCHICGKGFAQSSVLNTHMRLHTGRPEACKICEQRFCRPAELRLHMRKHTGEKPFLCTECGQAFIQRSHLVEHNKTHSDLRPYQCTYCEKAFKQNSSLKSHIQIHLGSKPFKCGQCPYACRQSYSLTQHMKQHPNDTPRPERPHMCLICNKTFTTVAMLTSHASTVHNVTTFVQVEAVL